MLAIKLRPVGKKKQISYRIAVMEKRSKLKGKFVEDLGWYNPHTDTSKINKERAQHWIEQGAQPTDSVHNLLVGQKVVEGTKVAVHAKSKKEPVPAPEAPEAASQEAPEVAPEEVTQEAPAAPEAAPEEQLAEASDEASQEEEKVESQPTEEAEPAPVDETKDSDEKKEE